VSGRSAFAPALIGREPEQARVEQLLATTRSGSGAALVVCGPTGIGKSRLLEFAVARAAGGQVLRLRGVAAEADLPYAALQPLCSHLLGHAGRARPARPEPDARAILEIAVGLRAGARPDPAELAAALQAMLASAAATESVLCVVDDAQWLDTSSRRALEIVAHRLAGLPVALLAAARGHGFADVPEIRLSGLDKAAARRLWESASPASVDESLIERILVEARGTPRLLLEAARLGGQGRLADDALDIEERLPRHLAPDSRLLLVLAAAEPTGDPALLTLAAARLGIGAKAARQAETEGLLSFDHRVAFRSPRLRACIYRLATAAERCRAHAALAAAADPADEPDRRAWHLALAGSAPDEAVAAELVRSASTAWERGGAPAAAAILEQAAMSTGDPVLRAERAISAAGMHRDAGAFETARALLAMAELGPADDVRRARIRLLRAGIGFDSTHTRAAAARLLRAATDAVAHGAVQPEAAFGEALAAEALTGGDDAVREVRRWMTGHSLHQAEVLLDHVARSRVDGYAAEVASSKPVRYPPSPLACSTAAELWDDQAWHRSTSLLLERARRLGMRALLPQALTHRALFETHAGRFDVAQFLVDESALVSEAVGTAPFSHAAVMLAAWRGLRNDPELVASETRRRPGEGVTHHPSGAHAMAVFYNGQGEYEKAVRTLLPALESDEIDAPGWSLAELAEAALRSGDRATAEAALARLSARTRPAGTDWALGVEARSRALLLDGQAAEDLYAEAIDRLRRCRIRTHHARAELVYGEWLRRRGRRVDSRVPLRSAYQAFLDMGAHAFAARAQRELLATSERARRRVEETRDVLTPHERQVAALARDGRSNPQIAALLSISPRTVEHHLHKVFVKLGIASRAELHRVLCAG
jgi:DNA-binding CsgD family transcriptional regulator